MDTLFWLAVATVIIVLFFDYTNGFHDAANIVATIIASRAMTPAQAVMVVGVFEFLGPLLGGDCGSQHDWQVRRSVDR
jgi:PiT family inorganic phosphate transporter